MEKYDDLRQEFNRPSFKKRLKVIKPPVCVVCGSLKNIHYHHIPALEFGGNNNIGNIVPMCPTCHNAVHYSNHLGKYRHVGKNVGGRPRKAKLTPEAEETLWKWANGEIGSRQCLRDLGHNPGNHIKETTIYKDFIKKHNIQNVRNTYDVVVANGKNIDGRLVSTIFYADGEREFGYYNPAP